MDQWAATAGSDRGIAGLSALVTGGGSGIGLGTAARLVRDGAHVTICGRTEERLRSAVAALEEVAAGLGGRRSPEGTAAYVVADVTVEEQVAAGGGRRPSANGAGSTSCSPTPADRCTWARSSTPTWTRCGPPSTSISSAPSSASSTAPR